MFKMLRASVKYNLHLKSIFCLLIVFISLLGCAPHYYNVIDKEGFYIQNKFDKTYTLWAKNCIIFSSKNEYCPYKINKDSILDILKNSLSSQALPIILDIQKSNKEEAFFNTLPIELLFSYESEKFNQACYEYIPILKRRFINENLIVDIANSANQKNQVTLVPIVVIENRFYCDYNYFKEDWEECNRGITKVGPNVHLGIYLVQNSEIIYYNSIGFFSNSVVDNFHPPMIQWNRAIQRVLANYIENSK